MAVTVAGIVPCRSWLEYRQHGARLQLHRQFVRGFYGRQPPGCAHGCRCISCIAGTSMVSISRLKHSPSRPVTCKQCGQPITFAKRGGKFWPVNPDGGNHFVTCKKFRNESKLRGQKVTVAAENAIKIRRGRRMVDVSGIYFLQPDGEKFWVQKHVGTITGKDFDPAKAWRAGSGTLPWVN